MEQNRFEADPVYLLVCLVLLGALLLSLLAAVSFGTVSIPLAQVYEVILEELRAMLPGGTTAAGGSVHDVVWLIRLPRLILAVGVGMGLSVCGAVM